MRWTSIDHDGHDLPVRQGGPDIAYEHYSKKHQLFSDKPIRAAVDGQHPVWFDGPRREYESVLTDSWGTVYARIRVINWDSPVTLDGVYVTPDGRPIGTITAWCRGVTICPSEVNG
ncbi:hypothetical protein [Parasphingorhabdus pacifica]